MTNNKYRFLSCLVLFVPFLLFAKEANKEFQTQGILAGAYQCQRISADIPARRVCRGSMPLQPTVEWYPTDNDVVFIKAGFNVSNGLNALSPFSETLWASDMLDDLKDINGRGRDHLLLAGYQHTYILAQARKLDAVLGVIDAADYLDENAYANDEFAQFMNPALTNGPNVFLPSYDRGLALNWEAGPWSVHGVIMNIGMNEHGQTYDFYGMQLAYATKLRGWVIGVRGTYEF